jgi:3-oxoacyl-[acyl-carrier protein] reductase
MTAVQEQVKKSSSKKLEGKVALVTGGSRGIGAAITLRLAADGAKVAVNYNNDKGAAEKIVAEATGLGAKAVAFKANVSSAEDTNRLIEEVTKALGKIDILVNNAGVYAVKPIEEVDAEHYTHLFDVNVKGVILTTVAALKKMSDGGRIISISSLAAKGTMPGSSVYSATKAALETLTRIWAQELGKRRITVNAVAPGTTATDMLEQGLPEELKQMITAKTALGRIGQPEDIADVVAFLASDDARWVTGHSISCDGGLTPSL